MDEVQKRVEKVQASLSALSLDVKEEASKKLVDKILVGKMMTTRKFHRGILANIIEGAWQTRRKVKVQCFDDNCFKFVFELKEDKVWAFERRPWCFNGALLILKEWTEELAIHEIKFDSTAFFVQIHGLPPKWLHSNNAEKIGSQLGVVYKDSLHKKTVVGSKYLRVRVEVPINIPLQAGFFFKKETGEELWIHFKYEKLLDFCFTCGLVSHVTGRCTLKDPAKVTSKQGIITRLYGPWLRASSRDFLTFLGPPVPETDAQSAKLNRKANFQILDTSKPTLPFDTSLAETLSRDNPSQTEIPLVGPDDVISRSGETYKELQAIVSAEVANLAAHWSRLDKKHWKDERLELLLNLSESNPTVGALKLTLQGRLAEYAPSVQQAFLSFAGKVGYDETQLELWAKEALNALKLVNRAETQQSTLSPPSGIKSPVVPHEPKTQRKRMALFESPCVTKKMALDGYDNESISSPPVPTTKNERKEAIGESSVRSSTRRWSWKKEARRRPGSRINIETHSVERINSQHAEVREIATPNVVGTVKQPHHEQ